MIVVNDSEHSDYTLEWTLEHFFVSLGDSALFKVAVGSSTDLDAVVPSSPGRGRYRRDPVLVDWGLAAVDGRELSYWHLCSYWRGNMIAD
ncbi:hypothetical protein SLE2022_238340 [Rubroshorea leprosula]